MYGQTTTLALLTGNVARLPAYLTKLLGVALLLLAVSACGFKLQGSTPLPFDTLLMKVPENSAFGADLRRAIRAASPNIVLIEEPDQPYDAALQQISSTRTAREVSLNAQGRVEEYELTLTYTFNVVSADGEIILPNSTLRARRNLPFDDRVVQAKEGEEATLFNQMQTSLVARIVRRISAPDVSQAWAELQSESQ